MKEILITIFLSLIASELIAGSRGYTAAIVDIGGEDFFESSVYSKNINGQFQSTERLQDCWIHRSTGVPGISTLMRKKIPEGLTQELVQAAWNGNKSATQEIQGILRRSKSPDGHHDIDGIYIVNAKKGTISIMGLGARGPINEKNPSRKVIIPWNEVNSSKGATEFDLALCAVSEPFDFGFNP